MKHSNMTSQIHDAEITDILSKVKMYSIWVQGLNHILLIGLEWWLACLNPTHCERPIGC